MISQRGIRKWVWLGLGLAAVAELGVGPTEAGERWFRKRTTTVVPTATRVRTSDPEKTLGTFGPTPVLVVRGNYEVGGGYSPNGIYGDAAMDIYGPLSAFREIAAPVVVYNRGYNGVVTPSVGTSFSSPNRPGLSPVIYPTQANNYYGFPTSNSPPWWQRAGGSVDEN